MSTRQRIEDCVRSAIGTDLVKVVVIDDVGFVSVSVWIKSDYVASTQGSLQLLLEDLKTAGIELILHIHQQIKPSSEWLQPFRRANAEWDF
jgi:hypothetical protein